MDNVISKLEVLHKKEIIRAIDLELCRFLEDCQPDISQEVLLSACLVSHLYGQGHICLMLEDYAGQNLFEEGTVDLPIPDLQKWKDLLSESSAVGSPGDYKPLILVDADRLYLHKLWHHEQTLADELIRKSSQQVENVNEQLLKDGLNRLFDPSADHPDWQQVAAATSVRNKLSIISGGPGTGKTSTVVRVLALILEQHQQTEETINIALAAPTGKATVRLQDSILSAKEGLNISEDIREAIPEEVRTLHQLLGASRHSSQFRHNADNPVPYDLVIVDEASMVDQALMSKLMEALLDDARLILLGDKDQLASVEAGSVLGDICNMEENKASKEMADWLKKIALPIPEQYISEHPKLLTDNITLLTKSYRFKEGSGIAKLSLAVNSGEVEQAISILTSDEFGDVGFTEIDQPSRLETILSEIIPDYFQAIIDAETPEKAIKAYNGFRLLAAHRRGPWGVRNINHLIEELLQQKGLIPKYAQWYPGKPVIINSNDYTLDLYNGDTGLCLPDDEGALKIYFKGENGLRSIAPSRLPDHETAYALTVHKSQGSEFEEVMLVLPQQKSKVLSRELIYTALTRARTKISIAANKSVLVDGIQKQIRRSSGLKEHLWH